MNRKQKLTAFLLATTLSASHSALAASGAPSSQFGFKGWPYRNNGCGTAWETASPCPTATPTPVPTETPAPTAEPTLQPTVEPTLQPTAAPTPLPTQEAPLPTPTQAPIPSPAATATPAPKPAQTPKITQKPAETVSPPSTSDDYTTGSITVQEENAFLLLNQDRISNNLSSLTLDPVLCQLARKKSEDMRDNHYFAHNSPTYGSASQMLKTFGYSFTAVGENIAHHATVEKAQAAFMSSSGHRRNILGTSWTKVGIGVCTDSQGYVYVTQLFVR